jgi:integrase
MMAGKVEKLSSGNYRVRTSYYDETGTQKFKSFTADTPEAAQLLALQFQTQRKHDSKPENISLKDMMESFINNRANILSPSTIVGYRQLARNAYKSIINVRLGLLTNENIQKCINEYAKDHSPKSVSNAIGLLSAVLKDKMELGIKTPQKRKSKIKIPTSEQTKLIIESARNTPLYLPVLCAALLGMRRSEIFALTYNDIDIANKTININKAIVLDEYREYVEKSTKTTSSERTLIAPYIIINEIDERQKNGQPLFDLTIEQFHFKYRNMCRKIGVPQSFHALRHYNASLMLQLNVPNKYAMERMGHTTDDMLNKVYQHTFSSEQTAIADRMHKFIEENLISPDR